MSLKTRKRNFKNKKTKLRKNKKQNFIEKRKHDVALKNT